MLLRFVTTTAFVFVTALMITPNDTRACSPPVPSWGLWTESLPDIPVDGAIRLSLGASDVEVATLEGLTVSVTDAGGAEVPGQSFGRSTGFYGTSVSTGEIAVVVWTPASPLDPQATYTVTVDANYDEMAVPGVQGWTKVLSVKTTADSLGEVTPVATEDLELRVFETRAGEEACCAIEPYYDSCRDEDVTETCFHRDYVAQPIVEFKLPQLSPEAAAQVMFHVSHAEFVRQFPAQSDFAESVKAGFPAGSTGDLCVQVVAEQLASGKKSEATLVCANAADTPDITLTAGQYWAPNCLEDAPAPGEPAETSDASDAGTSTDSTDSTDSSDSSDASNSGVPLPEDPAAGCSGAGGSAPLFPFMALGLLAFVRWRPRFSPAGCLD